MKRKMSVGLQGEEKGGRSWREEKTKMEEMEEMGRRERTVQQGVRRGGRRS